MDKKYEQIEESIDRWFDDNSIVKKSKKLRLSEPIFDSKEIKEILRVLMKSEGWIAQGPKVKEFEEKFARYIGVKYAVATNSGSSANLIALSALKEEGDIKDGDEVIIPAATFPTVATPVVQLGLKPVFVDVSLDGNIDPLEVNKAITSKTRVVMVVHTLGKPADINSINKVIKNKNIFLFEDACEAHGAKIGKKMVGSFGILGTFSFYVAHNITTSEGGMIVTNSKEVNLIAQSLRDFGRYKSDNNDGRFSVQDPILGKYDTRQLFSRIGYNLRMSDIEAAMGVVQLKKLDRFNKQRKNNADYLYKNLKQFKEYFYLPEMNEGTFHAYYGFLLILKPTNPFVRADLVGHLEKLNIETRPLFGGCLPDQPAFRGIRHRTVGQLANSRLMRDNALFVGCHPGLNTQDLQHIVTSITGFINKYK